MIVKLTEDNILTITQGSAINAYNSLKNNIEFYIANKVKTLDPALCDVLFIFIDKNKMIYSTILSKVESDVENFYKYQILDGNDFCIPSGYYTGYILIYDPIEKTHTTSITTRFLAIEGDDKDLNLAITANAIDEVMMNLNTMKKQMNTYLTKVKELTELNIKINNEIKQKGESD